jgi:hypothetical protein
MSLDTHNVEDRYIIRISFKKLFSCFEVSRFMDHAHSERVFQGFHDISFIIHDEQFFARKDILLHVWDPPSREMYPDCTLFSERPTVNSILVWRPRSCFTNNTENSAKVFLAEDTTSSDLCIHPGYVINSLAVLREEKAMDFMEKARVRLEHWISHNDHHREDYEKFLKELEAAGKKESARQMSEMMKLTLRSTQCLRKALKALGR